MQETFMKSRLLTYTLLALAAFASFSCKKDDETTETKPYLYGLNFDLPSFSRPGATYTVSPYGVYTEDGKNLEKITYKWKFNTDDFVEIDTFTFTVNEVGNFTITCQASDPDGNYYANSTSKVIIVVDPALGKTLKSTGIDPDKDEHIFDSRGKAGESEYYYTHIGELDWFRNNLAWTGAGLAYDGDDITSFPLGRYYTWDEAMTACPDGWRLPTDEEWATLGTQSGPLMCDAYLNNKKMWEFWPDVKITNSTQLSVIPSGYALPALTEPVFVSIYDYAAFWTATESETDSRMAAYRYMYVKEDLVRSAYGDKNSLALSVRCVR